ncbi:MAG: hypothetical protein AAF696_36835, partial [Bacteroidota bacterium]
MSEPIDYRKIISCSPFRIFIREGYKIPNRKLLDELGLSSYLYFPDIDKIRLGDYPNRYLYILEQQSWKQLIDDPSYGVWHTSELRPGIERLGKEFDILYCSIGDCDESFDFVYYEKGELRRKLIVDSPNYVDRVIREDIGIPFEFEEEAFQQKSIQKLFTDVTHE